MLDHAQRRAVLDRARRVVALQLGEDDVVGLAGQALQAHQRRVADELLDARITQMRNLKTLKEEREAKQQAEPTTEPTSEQRSTADESPGKGD
jgi:hypothetical protein